MSRVELDGTGLLVKRSGGMTLPQGYFGDWCLPVKLRGWSARYYVSPAVAFAKTMRGRRREQRARRRARTP